MTDAIASLEHRLLLQIETTEQLRLEMQHKEDALQTAKGVLLSVSDFFEHNPTSGNLPHAVRHAIVAIVAAQDGDGFE